jgi:hypothetical protein
MPVKVRKQAPLLKNSRQKTLKFQRKGADKEYGEFCPVGRRNRGSFFPYHYKFRFVGAKLDKKQRYFAAGSKDASGYFSRRMT